MQGLLVRKSNGDLRWYPFFKQGTKHTFYTSKEFNQTRTAFEVGKGFKFEKYLPGFWLRPLDDALHRNVRGGNSLVVLDDDGDLRFYPFRNETFYVEDQGKRVGRGFKPEWDFIVASWTGNGTSDLIVRDDEGHLRLFPWNGIEFEDLGGDERVGDGFHRDKYTHLLPGHWTDGKTPDLLVREENGDFWVYPFDGTTFKDQGKPKKVGRGFDDDFTQYLVGEWTKNGTPDLIVRHKRGELKLYPYGRFDSRKDYLHFSDGPYRTVGRGFREDWTYLPGYWRDCGTTDLLLCDDDEEMRFYPFNGNEFIDLPRSEKYVGKGWDFTHFWPFYPV
ncbi:hypothetical protein EU538_09830 [Candidatus Thorarchaeota archaeon]|nr:MAG: hypothetical protein EU538_09830 [Candidatus Thorarchaeota archaeon]